MSAPLPSALRTRFRKYIAEGPSGRAAAARLRVSPATGARWARQIRTRGHADPAVQGRPPGSGKLSPHRAFMEELVAQDPDITLFELRDALAEAEGVEVHHSSIARLLTRLGFTYKKVAGRHRTPPRKGKATARRLVRASPACDRRLARARGLSGRDSGKGEPHARPRQDPAWRAADNGRPVRQPGHANADRGADGGRVDRALGDQRCDG